MRRRNGRVSFLTVCLIGCLVMLFGLFASAIYLDGVEHERRHKQAQTQIEDFGTGVVAEIYAYRTGSKPANYHYPQVVVLINDDGERLKVFVGDRAPLKGDRWSLRVSQEYASSLMLDELIEE